MISVRAERCSSAREPTDECENRPERRRGHRPRRRDAADVPDPLRLFDRRANFQTWLISVSRNLCIDHYRSVRKERETIDRDVDANELSPLSHDPGPVAALEQQDRVQLLREAMSSLPETLRTAVLMRDIQELAYQEIADALRLPEGTVKSRINRGRTELARQIRKLRGEDYSPTGTSSDGRPRTGAYR